ncbi:MAG TPA: heme o synthase [Dongiaceae bacterium]|nr:heme o synthase [Dongiaceae bacterium]
MNPTDAVEVEAVAAPPARAFPSRLLDYLELTKPRVTGMVLLTTLAGFYMGSGGRSDTTRLLQLLFGTALAAAGASALNQYVEREADGRMRRTRARPLPAGRMEPAHALLFGGLLSIASLAHLALVVDPLVSGIVALTILSYVFIYTPLKSRCATSTLIGALPGALPALVGWTAAEGRLSAGGLSLLAILFVWQMPHALAIACLYREDYERGGFALLPVLGGGNARTGWVALAYAILLVPVSLLPAVFGYAGAPYVLGAILLGVLQALVVVPLLRDGSAGAARRLLIASVAYLPALLLLLALDRRAPIP